MSGKYGLIIANTEYSDMRLARLSAPGPDAEQFARVLRSQEICAFDEVQVLLNEPEAIVSEAIDAFFDERQRDDLLLLYFSGHGVRDEQGALYLAVKNTNRFRLRSTAIKSDFIREAMDQSRSKRQVLILDCCNSGAFAQGMKTETGGSMGLTTAFEGRGYGHVVLTASDAVQFAWEGDKVIGETSNSLFTHFLVKGLEGEADEDGDGKITVDELYEYAYEQIVNVTPKQTPNKSSSRQEGEIILRQGIPVANVRSVPLPTHLSLAIENPDPDVRFGVVQSLSRILKGNNIGLARSARQALERIAAEDDSRRVALAAKQALESVYQEHHSIQQGIEIEPPTSLKTPKDTVDPENVRQAGSEERKAKIFAALKASQERIKHQSVAPQSKANEETKQLPEQAQRKQLPSESVTTLPPISISNISKVAGIITGFILLSAIIYFVFRLNLPFSKAPSIETAVTTDALSLSIIQDTPTFGVNYTKTPSKTPTIIPSPTATFTPIATERLSIDAFIVFERSLPTSTPLGESTTVSGVVYNGYGPVRGAKVTLYKNHCSDILIEAITDEEGKFIFTNIATGNYDLGVWGPDRTGFCRESEILKAEGQAFSIDRILPQPYDKVIYPQNGAIVIDTHPTISWEIVPKAAYYRIDLMLESRDGLSASADQSWLTNSTTFTFPNALATGRTYWLNLTAYTAERLPLAQLSELPNYRFSVKVP